MYIGQVLVVTTVIALVWLKSIWNLFNDHNFHLREKCWYSRMEPKGFVHHCFVKRNSFLDRSEIVFNLIESVFLFFLGVFLSGAGGFQIIA